MMSKDQERRAAAFFLRHLADRIEESALKVELDAVRPVQPIAPENAGKIWNECKPGPVEFVGMKIEWEEQGDT